MTSPQTSKNNNLFWLAYAQAIQDKLGAKFGKSGAFFVANESQTGPIAGDFIPDEYTYQGLYGIGNNLLATDNLYYNPSALHGYVEALQTYLNWVDLGGRPDAAMKAKLVNANSNYDAARQGVVREQKKAFADYKEQKDMGLVPDGQTFQQWLANGGDPAVAALINQRDGYAAEIEQIQQMINGPMAATISSDRKKLAKALNEDFDSPGYNMHGFSGDVPSVDEIQRAQNTGQTIPTPQFQRIPAFDAPKYKKVVQEALSKVGNKYDPQDSVSVKLDTGKSTSDYDFGQSDQHSYSDHGWWWFGWGGSSTSHEDSESLVESSEESSVDLKVTFDSIQKIDITPGLWNFDVSKYKLRDDAPKDVKTLARVSQFVVATRLGYEITVGSKSASNIDKKYNRSSSSHDGWNIFGCWFDWDSGSSSSESKKSHSATWDSASKTIKVYPKNLTGLATVVGVIGEKFNIL